MIRNILIFSFYISVFIFSNKSYSGLAYLPINADYGLQPTLLINNQSSQSVEISVFYFYSSNSESFEMVQEIAQGSHLVVDVIDLFTKKVGPISNISYSVLYIPESISNEVSAQIKYLKDFGPQNKIQSANQKLTFQSFEKFNEINLWVSNTSKNLSHAKVLFMNSKSKVVEKREFEINSRKSTSLSFNPSHEIHRVEIKSEEPLFGVISEKNNLIPSSAIGQIYLNPNKNSNYYLFTNFEKNTSFVVQLSNSKFIDELENDLKTSFDKRKILIGNYKEGHGQFNRNFNLNTNSPTWNWHIDNVLGLYDYSGNDCDQSPYILELGLSEMGLVDHRVCFQSYRVIRKLNYEEVQLGRIGKGF